MRIAFVMSMLPTIVALALAIVIAAGPHTQKPPPCNPCSRTYGPVAVSRTQ